MDEADLLITNGKLVTWGNPNRILDGDALLIKNGCIAKIADAVELIARYPEVKQLDANRQIVMPGLICAHTHFYGAFSRGMSIPGEPPRDFPNILKKLWWRLDLALDEEAIRYSTLVCLIDAIRHGTTTLFDHHASPNMIDGSLDVIAEAVDIAGVRSVLCYEVTDRNGDQGARAGIEENIRFINKISSQRQTNSRIAATFGLHASLTLSDSTLAACREAVASGTGFHIHVAEHEVDESDSVAKSGIRVVDRLERYDLLGPHSLLVHGVHLDMHEIERVAQTNTWLSHQPRSNMNNGVGLPDVEKMLNAGIRVCLGNDGFSNTMWQEWKAAYLAHKLWNRDPRKMNALDVVRMGANNNSALAGSYFGTQIGVLEEGAQADLIFVDYHPYTPLTEDNLPWHIIFGFHESMVTTTIVAGKVLLRERQLLTLDEEAISAHALEIAPKIWASYHEQGHSS